MLKERISTVNNFFKFPHRYIYGKTLLQKCSHLQAHIHNVLWYVTAGILTSYDVNNNQMKLVPACEGKDGMDGTVASDVLGWQ